MEQISIFEMLKIGVGPSSSHTLGPWIAAKRWIDELVQNNVLESVTSISIELFGSLSMTGKGHATDKAIVLGLLGHDPVKIKVKDISTLINKVIEEKSINLKGEYLIHFDFYKDIYFKDSFLPYHPNGMIFSAVLNNGEIIQSTYFSVGGGFVVKDGEDIEDHLVSVNTFKYPIANAKELLSYCQSTGKKVSEIVLENECTLKNCEDINNDLLRIWQVMLEAIYEGCHTSGVLPGSLKVWRRAPSMHSRLLKNKAYSNIDEWMLFIKNENVKFSEIVSWISCFAIAVNEVNADLGRVVTAPTNGSAGVIPAVLLYYLLFINKDAGDKEIIQFLSVAGEIGSIFKKGATISAALGGCQAEIGVSSSMAAGALVELLGGTPEQVMVSAEIAMEHHLGMTCDPIDGLVQVPCIERNAMGAMKAITAAEMALHTNSDSTVVPLDKVIETMWQTAQDMNHNYKETSTGGLALAINFTDC